MEMKLLLGFVAMLVFSALLALALFGIAQLYFRVPGLLGTVASVVLSVALILVLVRAAGVPTRD